MRVQVFTIIAITTVAQANPRVITGTPLGGKAYLSSEHLSVLLSADAAQVRGVFTFSLDPPDQKHAKHTWAGVRLPIWLPDECGVEPSLDALYQLGRTMQIAPTRSNRAAFGKATLLEASAGKKRLRPELLTLYSRHAPKGALDYRLRIHERVPDEDMTDFLAFRGRGAACAVVQLGVWGSSLLGGAPISISYCQPLLRSGDSTQFVYLPSFYNLPPRVSTTDSNRFSITLTAAPGCFIEVVTGEKRQATVPGGSVVISPVHQQPVLVTVRSGSDQSSQATAAPRLDSDQRR